MDKNRSLSKAISDFENKFNRFKKSVGPEPNFLKKNETSDLDSNLKLTKERYKKSVIDNYKKFISPFQVFGKSSAIADQLEKDKENLVIAYNLYKAVHDLNKEKGNSETYIKAPNIETPLTKRDRYTKGGEFIYLQCWFIYEHKHNKTELVPQLEFNEKTDSWKLTFTQKNKWHITGNDLEIEAIISECFYPTDSSSSNS